MLESRGFQFLMAFVCYQLLVTAYYFQYVEGMEPCPLCIFQRIGVLFVGVCFLARAIHHPLAGSLARPIYASLGILSTILGGIVSGRHIYLQNLPEGEVPACGPALDYLVEMLPISEVIGAVLAGDGECAKVSWSLLGLSMPSWVMVFFIVCAAIFVLQLVNHFKSPKATL